MMCVSYDGTQAGRIVCYLAALSNLLCCVTWDDDDVCVHKDLERCGCGMFRGSASASTWEQRI
jgi:hypothetical protein